jgi:hypothetical protein
MARRKIKSGVGKKVREGRTGRSAKTFDWRACFDQTAARRSIAAMVRGCRRLDALELDPSLPAEAFASDLAGAVPRCEPYLPDGIRLDPKRTKASAAAAGRLARSRDLRCKEDPGPRLARMALALMSRGVRSLDFFYDGGWDEVSPIDEWPTIAFIDAPRGGAKESSRAAGAVVDWMKKSDAGFDINELMYRLLDDSGAGPPEYSQHFRIDLWRWKFRRYGYELVTYD